ncbi:hypothetical protein [Chitinophaga sp. RAB17]|uniref:hypothetical protein n=1 Tax=Chitinophaga sp. RAB17 TaxID=3233049 RepID=UPI003F93E2C1
MNNEPIYPEWYNQPFNLTINELSNPLGVIRDFCWQYSLSEIRSSLKEWYAASLSDEAANTMMIFTMYTDVERLISAVHLLNNQTKEKDENI